MTDRPTKDWHVVADKNDDGSPSYEICGAFPDGTGVCICTMGFGGGESWSGYVGEDVDAVLIAAAPKMLAALEMVALAACSPDRAGVLKRESEKLVAEALLAARGGK